MGFPRQEYCSGLPCPSPGDLSNPGIKPASPALAGGFFTTESPGKPQGAIIILNLKITKIGTERLIHLSKFTQLGQNGATQSHPSCAASPRGTAELGNGKAKVQNSWEWGGGLLFKGPYSPGLTQMIPTGSHLGIQVSFCPFDSLRNAAAAAAKSLQSCPTLCDPIDGSPPGSPVPGILQVRTLEWIAISSSNA